MKTKQLFAVSFACLALACEGVESEEVTEAAGSDALLGGLDCANVINMIQGNGILGHVRMAYVHEDHVAMSFAIATSSANVLEATGTANYNGEGSVAVDRIYYKLSRTFIGKTFIGSSLRVRLYKNSTGTNLLDVSMTPSECSVANGVATVTGIDGVGARFTAKMTLCTIEGC